MAKENNGPADGAKNVAIHFLLPVAVIYFLPRTNITNFVAVCFPDGFGFPEVLYVLWISVCTVQCTGAIC